MEKTCEFCGALHPLVYCQADAAFLCLSCDAKVHSANALSGRHTRMLVCDSCLVTPAHVRCLDHLMLMCRGCEHRLHRSLPYHRRHIMGSFTGCPSAKHFAALWGFGGGVSHMGQGSSHDGQFGSEPCVAKELGCFKFKSLGSNSQQKILIDDQQEQKRWLVKQQIHELEKLQLSEGNKQSSISHHHQDPTTFFSTYTTSRKLDEGQDKRQSISDNLLIFENPSQELKGERFVSPMSQLDQLSCSSSVVGDPFWQNKSPVDNNTQFWYQNLQDLGVCEDLGSLDDLNIPDVDLTFRNFEDLFPGDLDLTRALLEDENTTFSDFEKGNNHSKTTEDISAASSISISKDTNMNNEGKTSDQKHTNQWLSKSVEYSSQMMRSASFSRSRLSAESSGSECLDSGFSGTTTIERNLHNNDRKKSRRQGKQAQMAPLKAKGEMHKRIKGRSMSLGGYESDSINFTNGY